METITGANARLFSLGRHALVAGLKVCGASPGDKVLVPALICRDLLASIHALEMVPVFYPVDRSLAPLLLPNTPGARAILAVNYFGFPQPLDGFRRFCAEHGAFLVEDNAHGFLSSDAAGNALGTRGDIGIFSMRKTFPLPDGAALLVNRPEWAGRLPAPLPCRNQSLPAALAVKETLRSIQRVTGMRVLDRGRQVARLCRRLATGDAFPASSQASELGIPGAPAIHCVSLRKLDEIDRLREIERRRSLYLDFEGRLAHAGIEPVFRDLPQGVTPYGFPFHAENPVAAHAARIASRAGYDCIRWPDLPSAVGQSAPDFYRQIWCVNFLC